MSGEYNVGVALGAVMGLGTDFKMARGLANIGTATQAVQTGLSNVVAAVATLEDDPVTGAGGARLVSCQIDTNGQITLKLWDETGTAATVFGTGDMDVSWVAIGT